MLEQYMTSPAAIWGMFFAVAAVSGMGVDAIGRGLWGLYVRGKPIAITVPPMPGEKANVRRVKKDRKGFWSQKVGDEGRSVVLSADAAFPSNWGPVYLVDSDGYALVSPTKDEPGIEAKTGLDIKSDAIKYRRFRIWDALVNWRACRENDMEDLYSSVKDKEHWAVKLAPLALIVVGIMTLLIGFMLWKVMPIIQANAGGG